MPVMEIPFVSTEGNAGAVQNSRETLVNMYLETGKGRHPFVLRQRPAVVRTLANTGEKRCIEKHKDTHYLIIGSGFYSWDGTTLTQLGSLNTTTGRCTMVFNDNDEIAISDGTTLYSYISSTLSEVTLPDGVTCGTLAYLAGYAIFNNPGTGQFYWTGLNDFSSVNALDFATAESIPDNLTTVFVEHDELWLPGPTSTEIWQLTGGADSPFAPFTNARLRRGTAAALSFAAEDNTVIFLGDDKIIYRAEGYIPVRISTEAIEDHIGDATANQIASAYSLIFTVKGRKFYVLTIPGHGSYMYKFGSPSPWSRPSTYDSESWDVIGSAGHNSDYYLTETGICTLQFGINQDEGGIFRRGVISSPGWNAGNRFSIHSFMADVEVGRAPAGVEPELMLRVARDGETLGNIRTRSLGTIGEYTRRVIWRNCGQARKPVFELFMTDNAELTINSAVANMTADA